MSETGAVGMPFIDFAQRDRMRVDGVARTVTAHPALAKYPEAQFLVVVEAKRIYPNCPRYIHKYQLVERSRFVPRAGTRTPVPGWKRSDWACDVLPPWS